MDPEFADALKNAGDRLHRSRAVLLPDLFVDHLVPVPRMQTFQSGLDRVLAQGGGNVILPDHHLKVGGNAANTALALAHLGVPTTLITQTDRVGSALWETASQGLPTTDQGIQDVTHPSTTVALELQEESANLMLSDPGPLTDLHPDDLPKESWQWIEVADLVAVTNWAQTRNHGTLLLQETLRHARNGKTFSFLDTGDPAHRGEDAQQLLLDDQVLHGLGAWGMNENEVRFFASYLLDEDPHRLGFEDAAMALGRHIGTRLDVHTHGYAFSIHDSKIVKVPSIDVTPKHRTGAGDAWNAGNLAGTLLGLDDARRLLLAHAVAAITIGGATGGPPTLDQVIGLLESGP